MSLDLGPPLRAAIIDQQDPALTAIAASIVALLGEWQGEACVFAYRPIPDDAPDPVIIINAPAAISDGDGLTSDRPVVELDIATYGTRGQIGGSSDQTVAVEAIGFALRQLFHRQKFSVQPEGYSVIEIVASGPFPAPVDDDGEVGRLVSLTIRLRRNP